MANQLGCIRPPILLVALQRNLFHLTEQILLGALELGGCETVTFDSESFGNQSFERLGDTILPRYRDLHERIRRTNPSIGSRECLKKGCIRSSAQLIQPRAEQGETQPLSHQVSPISSRAFGPSRQL